MALLLLGMRRADDECRARAGAERQGIATRETATARH